jgi:hypothetical protein
VRNDLGAVAIPVAKESVSVAAGKLSSVNY